MNVRAVCGHGRDRTLLSHNETGRVVSCFIARVAEDLMSMFRRTQIEERMPMIIRRPDIRAAVIAGITAGAGYLVQQEIDNRLTGRNLDDLLLLSRPIAKTKLRAKTLGCLIHVTNSAGIGMIYAV